MTKVLLIQPPPPMPNFGNVLSLGLCSIAAFLRGQGIEARVVDLARHSLPEDWVPDIIGIGAATPYARKAIATAKDIRRLFPDARIVFGGHHFSAMPEDAFPHADAVVRGEGELAMLDICQQGIRHRVIKGTPLASIDDIPPFDDELMDALFAGRPGRLNIVGARGCPFSCVFCAEHTKKIRYQSVDRFVDTVERMARRYHNEIFISDDIFTLNKARSTEICEQFIARGLNLRLTVLGHVQCFDEDLLKLLKRAGVHTLSYGIESGNNEILKLINKKFRTEQAAEVIHRTAASGIMVNCLYMVGNIGETEETVADTVAFARTHSDVRWCSYALPFPGTQFHKVADKYGTVLTRDWEMYTNQNVVFIPQGLTEATMRTARDAIVQRPPVVAGRAVAKPQPATV